MRLFSDAWHFPFRTLYKPFQSHDSFATTVRICVDTKSASCYSGAETASFPDLIGPKLLYGLYAHWCIYNTIISTIKRTHFTKRKNVTLFVAAPTLQPCISIHLRRISAPILNLKL